jgi:hypothetical protein
MTGSMLRNQLLYGKGESGGVSGAQLPKSSDDVGLIPFDARWLLRPCGHALLPHQSN